MKVTYSEVTNTLAYYGIDLTMPVNSFMIEFLLVLHDPTLCSWILALPTISLGR